MIEIVNYLESAIAATRLILSGRYTNMSYLLIYVQVYVLKVFSEVSRQSLSYDRLDKWKKRNLATV